MRISEIHVFPRMVRHNHELKKGGGVYSKVGPPGGGGGVTWLFKGGNVTNC